MKYKKIFIAIFIILLLSGCKNNSTNLDYSKCYYNNQEYSMYDDSGRRISSFWFVSDSDSRKEKVIFRNIDDENLELKKNAKIYNNNEELFLKYDDNLYAKTDCHFPILNDDIVIERIVIMSEQNENFFDDDCINITNEQDIESIRNLLLKCNNENNNSKNFIKEKLSTDDFDIGIKFADFPAIYGYGYISICEDDRYGVFCYDKNHENYLFVIDDEVSKILSKYKFN